MALIYKPKDEDKLPDGVYELSDESQVVLASAFMRQWRIAQKHIKKEIQHER